MTKDEKFLVNWTRCTTSIATGLGIILIASGNGGLGVICFAFALGGLILLGKAKKEYA